MAERAGKSGLVHNAPCRGVGVKASDSGAQSVEARLLGGEDEGVGLLDRALDEPGREGARVVGRVAADDAAGVHDHGLTPADLAIGRATVWTGGVRPGRDNRLERNGLGALVVEELLDRPRDIPFGPPYEGLLNQPLEDPVGDLTRALDRSELDVVLDRTKPLDETPPRNGLDRATPQSLVTGVRDEIGFEPDGPRQPAGEIGKQRPLRLLELHAFDGARRLRVAEVAEQASAVLLDQERSVRAPEPEEVEDVRWVGDEQRLLEHLPQTLDARVHRAAPTCWTMNSSASRYPSAPLPSTRFAARSATTDVRRHSSRSLMFERCTSTMGASNSSRASRIAYE